MNTLYLLRKQLRIFLIVISTLLITGFAANSQCWEDFYVYQTSPGGALCSPQYVTLRAQYNAQPGSWVYGEFRLYTSDTDPNPIQTGWVYSDIENYVDFSVYANNGVTVWISYYNYTTGCESYRTPYSFYIQPSPSLSQDYAIKCGYDVAKVQLSSNTSGVYFELYKLVEYYDPTWGYVQEYQHQQSNTTGYFEIYDWWPEDQDKYYAKIYQPWGCYQSWYYQLWFEVLDGSAPTVSGNTTICQGSTTTLTVSHPNQWYTHWFDAANNLVYVGYQYATPSSLPAGNHTFTVKARSSDGTCYSEPGYVTVNVEPKPVDASIRASSTTIYYGQSIVITSSGGTGVPHYWCSSDGGNSWNIFQDSYIGQYSFSFTPPVPGTYRFHVRNRTSCGFCWDVAGGCVDFPYVDVTVTAPPPVITYTPLFNSSNFTRSIDQSKQVGVIAASSGTSATGGATYSIPVYTPPGSNGLQPGVNISYNSQGGPGLVGFGWNIEGLSLISRSGRNIYHNGLVKPVTYTNQDAFMLDGVRLNPINGANGANGTTYATEVENYAKINSNGGNGSSPEWFKVTAKNGTTMEYGKTVDSRLLTDDGQHVLLWRLSRIIDINGNYIDFTYTQEGRDSRINEINYTGNINNGQLPYNKIKFTYDLRSDQSTAYEAGASIQSKHLLKNISVQQEGTAMKAYQFNYGFDNIHSFLKEVIETGSDGTALNSTIFLYGDQPQNLEVLTTTALTGSYDFFSGDFDADGRTDLLAAQLYYSSGIKYHSNYQILSDMTAGSAALLYTKPLNSGNSVNSSDKKFNNFLTSDYNGDGVDDVLVINSQLQNVNPSGQKRVLNNATINFTGAFNPSTGLTDHTTSTYPSPYTFENYNWIHDKGNYFIPGDFDGNGNQDYILVLARKRTEGFPPRDYFGFKAFLTSPSTGETNSEIINFGYGSYPAPDFYANTVAESDGVIPIDFDGDGKTELLVVKDAQSYVLGIQLLPPSTGYSYGGTVLLTTSEVEKNSRVYPGDFNGDRKTDLLVRNSNGTWKILYSTGSAFIASGFTFNQSPNITGTYSDDKVIVSDYNGDGKSDILHGFPHWEGSVSNSSRFSLYYSRGGISGSGFYYEQYVYNNVLSFGEFVVGDFNGDGRSDLLNRYNVSSPADFISFKPKGKERLLVKVMDGHNLTTGFDYQLLTQNPAYPYFYQRTVATTDPANQGPFNYVQFPVQAVSSLIVPNGIGGTAVTSFRYEDAVVHRHAKGFLGFKKITAQNSTTGVKVVTENDINTQFATAFGKKVTASLIATGQLISESGSNITFTSLSTGYNDPKRYFYRVNQALNIDHVKGTATETLNTYDDYGNVTSTVVKTGVPNGSSVSATETVTTNVTYGTHNTPVPARPETITVSKSRSGMAALSNTTVITYTASGQPQIQVEFSGLPKAVTTTYGYNAFGNITSKTIGASGFNNRVNTFGYETKGRFATSKQVTGNGVSQTETYTYDFKWGKPASHTSFDCLTTTYEYDAFGRPKKTIVPAGYTIDHSLVWWAQGEWIYYSFTNYPGGNPDTKIWFDRMGRQVRKQTGTLNGNWVTQTMSYNAKGQIANRTSPYGSNETPVSSNFTYDDFGRAITESNQIRTTQISYTNLSNGQTQFTTTTAQQSKSKIIDAAGRVISAIDAGGQLDFQYDSRGNQLEVKHGSTILVSSTFDTYGRMQTQIEKNAGAINYEYDAHGQLKTQTNNLGHTYSMVYDDLGRMTSSQGPDGVTTYEYYKDIATGCNNNNLAKVTAPNGIIKEYTYDNLKRLQSEKVTVDGTANTTSYEYNSYDGVSKVTYPSGVVVNYGYDNSGVLNSVSGGNAGSPTTLFTASQINGLGQYTNYTLGNNRTSQSWFNYGFPSRFYTQGIQDLNMDFDVTKGNLSSRQDAIRNITETFQYDALNRLTQTAVNGQQQLNITFDGNSSYSMGNILNKTDAGNYVYKTDKVHAVAYITNPAGPTAPPITNSINQQQITYTSFMRTATITEDNFQLAYTYGPDQNRVKSVLQQAGSTLETKYYFGNYEKQIKGGVTREIHYVSAGNKLCAIIVREGGANQFYFVYTDHLGSLVTLTDINANIVAEQNFDAWGRNRNPANWTYSSVPAVPAWLYRGYTGHEHLSTFALINMNGRLYDPVQARMLSPDNFIMTPYGTQGYNRYAYALNNPLLYTDPDGNFIWILVAAAVFAVGNTVAHAINGDIDNFWDGLKYFAQGAVVGAALAAGVTAGLGVPVLGTIIKAAGIIYAGTTALSVVSGLGRGIFTGDWSGLGHAGKIFLGNFYLDENRTFFGGVLQGISRFTWESIQTTIGYGYTQLRNTFGGVDEVVFFGGVTFAFNTNVEPGTGWGVSIGNYINLRIADENTDILSRDLYMHEYGHTLQSLRLGPLYPFAIMIPSVLSSGGDQIPGGPVGFTEHDITAHEMGANRLAARYFAKFYGIDWTNFEPPLGGYPRRWP